MTQAQTRSTHKENKTPVHLNAPLCSIATALWWGETGWNSTVLNATSWKRCLNLFLLYIKFTQVVKEGHYTELSRLYSQALKDGYCHASAPRLLKGMFSLYLLQTCLPLKAAKTKATITNDSIHPWQRVLVQHMKLKQILDLWPGSTIHSRCYAVVCLKWIQMFFL